MTAEFIIKTIMEIIVGGAIIYCAFNEKKLIAFEDRIRERHIARKNARCAVIINSGDKASHCA